jgi:uncharacterized protein (TIGR03083 family)
MSEVSAGTYLEHFKRDGVRIADIARGHLDVEVSTCPGNTIGSLLVHTGYVCMFWRDILVENAPRQPDWSAFPTDPIEAHTTLHADVVRLLAARDPDSTTWTFFGDGPVRFWYRRAAQEFAVHRWDFENALGSPEVIDPDLAADGIDEMLHVFGVATGTEAFRGGSERFGGHGETFRLEPSDHSRAFTFAAQPDRFESTDTDTPDVIARAPASDLLLFLWGRVPPASLEVEGDASLLERWQERVKI